MLAQHHETAAVGRIAARECRFSAHRHLSRSRGAPKLLEAVREKAGAGAAGSVVAAARQKGVRAFDPDVVGVKIVSLSQLDSVPSEALEERLREREIAVVRIEDVD